MRPASIATVSIHAAHAGGDPRAPVVALVSIHAAHAGGDASSCALRCIADCFNPRRPRGRRQRPGAIVQRRRRRFNPRRPRGRRLLPTHVHSRRRAVSIHAAHAGGDAPCRCLNPPLHVFQSTPPTRAATYTAPALRASLMFQSTPPTRAATASCQLQLWIACVSIHAAHEGGDDTRPHEATCPEHVSIHAAHEGGDRSTIALITTLAGVSIHAAHEGGDARWRDRLALRTLFQSTPPARAATPDSRRRARHCGVSIHAAHEGGDARSGASCMALQRFQSTPPTRAAT